MAKYTNIEQLFQKVNKDLEEVRTEFYKGLVEVLVEKSPVDTGAYMDSHSVGTDTKSIGYKSKEGEHKAQNVPRGPVVERALERLNGQIESLPKDAEKVYISNRSPHANVVEEGGHRWNRGGYYPFKIMRREAKRVLASVISKVKGGSQ